MSKTCPQCGAVTVAEARFCRSCGRSFTDQLSRDTPGAASSSSRPLGETRIDTGGLNADDLPTTVAFDTVVDRNLQQQSSNFDPKATQYVGNSAQSTPLDPDQMSHNAAPTSMLSPQPTVNLVSTKANIPAPDAAEARENNAATTNFQPQQTFPQQPPIASQQTSVPRSGSTQTGVVRPPQQNAPRRKGGLQAWHIIAGLTALILILGGLAAAFLLIGKFGVLNNTAQATPTPAASPAAPPSVASLLTEAESLAAAGDNEGALARLRQAIQLEPANAGAQKRLGDALLKTGGRAEAIAAYRAATAADPKDDVAWRSLAAAQYDEGQYQDSVDSYRQYIASIGGAPGEEVELALADALRGAGQMDEAKASYEKLSLSSSEAIASSARQRLTELAQETQPQNAPTPEATRVARNNNNKANQTQTPQPSATASSIVITRPTVAPTVAPTQQQQQQQQPLTATDHYRRGVELWGGNRAAAVKEFLAAQSNPDACYYLGLNMAEGRDPSALNRAQLVSALFYFQNAQRGTHAAQARQYVERLEKEYDRRRGGN